MICYCSSLRMKFKLFVEHYTFFFSEQYLELIIFRVCFVIVLQKSVHISGSFDFYLYHHLAISAKKIRAMYAGFCFVINRKKKYF